MLDKFSVEDRDLVLALKSGDKGAFKTLYNKYKTQMVLFTIRFIKQKDAAEDIYHDAFAQIWLSRESLDETKSFSSFLYIVIKNRTLDQIRKKIQDQSFRSQLGEDLSHDESLNGVMSQDFDKLFKESLNLLTHKQREVYLMSRSEYKTYQEIAESLDISVNTVKSHMTSATSILRKFINKHIL